MDTGAPGRQTRAVKERFENSKTAGEMSRDGNCATFSGAEQHLLMSAEEDHRDTQMARPQRDLESRSLGVAIVAAEGGSMPWRG